MVKRNIGWEKGTDKCSIGGNRGELIATDSKWVAKRGMGGDGREHGW